jgi:hypothetical protein
VTASQGVRPLPRFWYFPNGVEALVVMTGDDRGVTGGTAARFDQFIAASPGGCALDDWECVRATAYVAPGSPMTAAEALSYEAQGFDIAFQASTGCSDYTPSSLAASYASQLGQWMVQFAGIAAPLTERTQCVAWSDYDSQPQVQASHGIRLDTNYYYWPPVWAADRPGFFTGSGMPMRFAKADGTLIDVYQAATQLTDESGQSYPLTIGALLDNAIGASGYYGVFTANMSADPAASASAASIVASAQARGIPVISGRQLLRWLDGRSNSAFADLVWNGTTLSFSITTAAGARGLQAMVPVPDGLQVTGVTAGGNAMPWSVAVVKGVTYAVFTAGPGAYHVTFEP